MDIAAHARSLFDLTLTPDQQARFSAYTDGLIDWNRQTNLTAISDPLAISVKHMLDCMALSRVVGPIAKKNSAFSFIDVGSGAGFPGLVVKILYPFARITLVESIGKKARFLSHMAPILTPAGTPTPDVLSARAEDLAMDRRLREHFDVASARAVAPLSTLTEYLLPFVMIGGIAIAMKGQRATEEMEAATRAIQVLGGAEAMRMPYTLPGETDPRSLVVIPKISRTPNEYPRPAGIAKKSPLE